LRKSKTHYFGIFIPIICNKMFQKQYYLNNSWTIRRDKQFLFQINDIWDKFPFMENSGVKYVLGAMARLLRPLVKLLLEKGISYDQAADVLRKTYCDVAFTDAFALPGKKQTDSRVSVLTGLTRKDVARLKEMTLGSPGLMANHNRATRVTSGWWLDHPKDGALAGAAPLPLEGSDSSFSALVRKYSGDMPVRAVLDELVRIGMVRVNGNVVELVSRDNVRHADQSVQFDILGTSVSGLIETIAHNMEAKEDDLWLQRRVRYDNIPTEHVALVTRIVRTLAESAIDSARLQMSQYDRDSNPNVEGSGRNQLTFGLYFTNETVPSVEDESSTDLNVKTIMKKVSSK
jgi:hypothetical protein